MAHIVHFEVTNQSGNLFSHSERFQVVGLARVRVREEKDKFFRDKFGTVRRFIARSSRPFAVVVVSDHYDNKADHSSVWTKQSEEEK